MAEMNKEPAERINFSTAKSLFEKDKVKTISKSTSWTTSSSPGPLTQINISNGGKMENMVKGDSPQAPYGGVEISSEPWKPTPRMSSSTSFDSTTDGPKINFILPKKRGDTSDLRWLTTVHNSKPPGRTSALSEKVKTDTNDTNRGLQKNQGHMMNGAGLPATTHGKSQGLSKAAKCFHFDL